jgi:hypothetical protein
MDILKEQKLIGKVQQLCDIKTEVTNPVDVQALPIQALPNG